MGAFIYALKCILLRPGDFFENMAAEHPISWALGFYLKLILAEILITFGIGMMILGQGFGLLMPLFLKAPIVFTITVAMTFLGIIAALFIGAAIMHIFVWILRGKGGFSGTFTILVCGNAVQILFFLAAPVLIFSMQRPGLSNLFLVGGAAVYVLAVAAWMIIVQIIGYMKIHEMGILRAIAALLMPAILFTLLGLSPVKSHIPKFGDKLSVLKNKTEQIILAQQTVKAPAPVPSGSIEWRYDLAAALQDASAKKSIVMADFYTDWCGWCKKLDNETYADKDVSGLAKQFICVKIDGDKNVSFVERYRVRAYPTIIFLNPDGTEAKRVDGYINAQELTALMKQVKPQEAAIMSQPAKQELADTSSKDKEIKSALVKKFNLEGIVYMQSGYSAVVNGSYVKAGDVIGDAKVVEVSKERVRIVEADGKEIVLRL